MSTQPKYRLDYKPVPVHVPSLDLDFVVGQGGTTIVTNSMVWKPRDEAAGIPAEGIYLNGRKDLELLNFFINGSEVAKSIYTITEDGMTIAPAAFPPAQQWDVRIVVQIRPQDNTLLEGLYASNGMLCTQCEAEGFRGITYFFDRPDVMSKFTCRIEADKQSYPVLLSNGNLQSSGDVSDGRHFAVWVDPFPKPCYLFALVAGELNCKSDQFVTKSGRQVDLRIYVRGADIAKVDHAMASLKVVFQHRCAVAFYHFFKSCFFQKAMKWDEDTYGLEYDLDLFNIVAVDDFNMGAMENKSLNIFNSRLVLATPDTASDFDFGRIEGVIAHEYFHNWTGDRVTCRDWFQLTLKEGLTVYRVSFIDSYIAPASLIMVQDQEFSSDMNSRPVFRVETVRTLRAAQFPEDRGPMAHPVRPDSYIKM
jgi:aminopeptidase N